MNRISPELISRDVVFDGYFKINRLEIQQPSLANGPSRRVTRYVFERGDAAAVVLYDPERRAVALVRQLRAPPLVRGDSGWMLEIVAGSLKSDEHPRETALKEIQEEAGVTGDLTSLGMFYLSPGGSSERCFLFACPVETENMQGRVGGEKGTSEEVILEIYSIEQAMDMIQSGQIVDAKTIIAIQHLALTLL